MQHTTTEQNAPATLKAIPAELITVILSQGDSVAAIKNYMLTSKENMKVIEDMLKSPSALLYMLSHLSPQQIVQLGAEFFKPDSPYYKSLESKARNEVFDKSNSMAIICFAVLGNPRWTYVQMKSGDDSVLARAFTSLKADKELIKTDPSILKYLEILARSLRAAYELLSDHALFNTLGNREAYFGGYINLNRVIFDRHTYQILANKERERYRRASMMAPIPHDFNENNIKRPLTEEKFKPHFYDLPELEINAPYPLSVDCAFKGLYFGGISAQGMVLYDVNCSEAIFTGSDISGSYLHNVNFTNADLSDVMMKDVRMVNPILENTRFLTPEAFSSPESFTAALTHLNHSICSMKIDESVRTKIQECALKQILTHVEKKLTEIEKLRANQTFFSKPANQERLLTDLQLTKDLLQEAFNHPYFSQHRESGIKQSANQAFSSLASLFGKAKVTLVTTPAQDKLQEIIDRSQKIEIQRPVAPATKLPIQPKRGA